MRLDQRILTRAVALVEKGNVVLSTARPNPPGVIGFPTLDVKAYNNWRSQSLAFLTDLLGTAHVYTNDFQESTGQKGYKAGTNAGIGILQAVVEDVEQGFIETVRQLIIAEVFSDFFEQATYLLEKGYKAPAASLAGAVLENGLRSIASSNGVQVKTIDDLSSLNGRIASKGIYNRLFQKKVSVWIDVRNAADHGKFDDFSDQDVNELIKGAQSLLADFL